MSTEFYWLAVVATTIISSARITRLAVYDKFPPAQWIRDKYLDATDGSGWGLLALCGYCMSFWVTGVIMIWADLAGALDREPAFGWSGDTSIPVWWLFNGLFAMSYLAAWFVANDGDNSEDED